MITIDLLGHGRSDRPPQMVHYSMTFFARQVEALLDHLEIDRAVIGGTSLGANTTLETAYLAPDRVKGMMVEMPVLDNALLAAAVIFTPIMLGLRFGEPAAARSSLRALAEMPRSNPCSTSASTGCARTLRPPPRCSRASSSAPPPRTMTSGCR